FLEEIVDRAADDVAHASDYAERVCAGAQMGPFAELLERMTLLLERVLLGIGPAVNGDAPRVQLGLLPFARGLFDLAFDRNAGTGAEAFDFDFVVLQRRIGNDLEVSQRRAVIELDKAEAAF